MVYNTQDHWVTELCSLEFQISRKRFGNCICFHLQLGEGDTYSVGFLERTKRKETPALIGFLERMNLSHWTVT
jgi:hypothetical protein